MRTVGTAQITPPLPNKLRPAPEGLALFICIDPEVNKQILDHLDRKVQAKLPMLIPEGRAPPSFGLFD